MRILKHEVKAIYSWYVKNPVSHADRKQTFWNAGQFSTQLSRSNVENFVSIAQAVAEKANLKEKKKGEKVRASADVPQHG